jgi:hypothetical protein
MYCSSPVGWIENDAHQKIEKNYRRERKYFLNALTVTIAT